MRRYLFILIGMAVANISYACTTSHVGATTTSIDPYTHPQSSVRYVMYPTENLWNFLELDTRTGEVWQVQFDINGDNRFKEKIVASQLDYDADEASAPDGRFVLYPTQNRFTFLLVDQTTGDVFQIQWTLTPEESVQGVVARIWEY